MNANYHTHTYRCNHAKGEDREYVERAIANGIKVLGFSDHSPMIYDTPGYHSGFRMELSQAEEYCRAISDLKEEYKNDIEIHIGFEAEYYPATHSRFMEFIKQYPIEYLILGQHFIVREEDRLLSTKDYSDPDMLRRYYRNVYEGLRTGDFIYVAHPDMMNFTGDQRVYSEETQKFLYAVKELGYPIEINRLGFSDFRHYPYDPFWQIAGFVGNDAIIGVDAHSPRHFDDTGGIKGCADIAARYRVNLIDWLDIEKNGIKK